MLTIRQARMFPKMLMKIVVSRKRIVMMRKLIVMKGLLVMRIVMVA